MGLQTHFADLHVLRLELDPDGDHQSTFRNRGTAGPTCGADLRQAQSLIRVEDNRPALNRGHGGVRTHE
ncbi:hypothetical protein Pla52n_50480 [Stieleria varia]|uniref:Uncharacterized protein n=1 Tax=Stieleria varia TaxID=2528005 RepID=A0A5C6AER8_9BACT|nr:hypothetical protein Pla52n_50480 [Stieleria varia]